MRCPSLPPDDTTRSSETDPLVPGRASRYRSVSLTQWICPAVIAVIMICIFVSTFSVGSDDRDRIREEWEIERRQHNEEVLKRIDIEHRWRVEDDKRIHLREQWVRETEEHERNLTEAVRRELHDKEARRTQWATEKEEHERKYSEAIQRENKEKEARRVQWEREVDKEKERQAQFERNMEEMQAQWRREVAQRWVQWEKEVEEHNRAIEERESREEHERLRLNIHWSDPESRQCTTYGTREYTARLVNVPADYDRRVEACMAMPIQIHRTEYKTKWCEDHGPSNVTGHWEVDQREPDCASYWNWYGDHGCVSPGSGQRRIEHYLENLPQGSDWREFCASTPVSFRGMHFIGAQFCFQKDYGTYGHWVFDDESCN